MMRKFYLTLISVFIICSLLTSCKQVYDTSTNVLSNTEIQSICKLATLECFYHNVAKSDKSGSWFEKDRKFWIEYTGIVKIGIDFSKVNIKVDNEKVSVFLPNAEILRIDISEDDLTEKSYIKSADGLIKNKITANDQSVAIEAAQKQMEKDAQENKTLLLNARNRAQKLIENYIKQFGDLSNINYQIEWIYENIPEKESVQN